MLKRILSGAIGIFTGEGRWILLCAVAAAAAVLYAWGARGHAERDAALAWADRTCAATGAPYRPLTVAQPGGPIPTVYPPGVRCEQAVADLAAFRRDAAVSTAKLLADAMAAQDVKRTRDLTAAARAARDMRAAATMMENANASVGPDDRVGRDWFDALNRTGGLRAPAD